MTEELLDDANKDEEDAVEDDPDSVSFDAMDDFEE